MPSAAKTPPVPSLSRWTQTRRFLGDPISLLSESRDECGDVFALNFLGLGPWVFVSSPDGVRDMFKAPRDVLGAGDIHYRMLAGLFGRHAIFTLDGDPHRQRQRMVLPQLNGTVVEQYVDLMVAVTDRTTDAWPVGKPFSLLPVAHRIALDILVGIAFGDESPERSQALSDQFHDFAENGTRSLLIRVPWLQIDLGRFSPWGRILRLRDATREAFRDALREIDQPTPLLDALRSGASEGEPLSEDDQLDEITTLLFAGHETTGTVATWALECILSRAEVHERVLAELDEVVGDGPITAAAVPNLLYLDAVIQESTRYRPASAISAFREVLQPFELQGWEIPPGWVIAHSFPVMSRRADLFPDPDRFDPERFLGTVPKPYHWSPFGGGSRVCAGRGVAQTELKVVIGTILRRRTLQLVDSQVGISRSGQFIAPSHGLRVVVRD